jgi:hypothetical protein
MFYIDVSKGVNGYSSISIDVIDLEDSLSLSGRYFLLIAWKKLDIVTVVSVSLAAKLNLN